MKNNFKLLPLLGLSALLLSGAAVGTAADITAPAKADSQIKQAAVEAVWMTDFNAAKAKAKAEKKIMLLDFTGSDWCGWCIKLHNEVFSKPEFAKWSKDKAILVMLDFPSKKAQSDEVKAQNAKLAKEYGVQGFPTIFITDADGKVLAQTGYQAGGAANYIKHLDSLLKANQNVAVSEGAWMIDFAAAKAKAKAEKKPMLLNFTGSDWCGWCVKLHKEVFSKPEFEKWSKDNVVLVKLDFPSQKPLPHKIRRQNENLAEAYDIQGFPTILLTDADGKVFNKTGYRSGGVAKYIEHLNKLLKK